MTASDHFRPSSFVALSVLLAAIMFHPAGILAQGRTTDPVEVAFRLVRAAYDSSDWDAALARVDAFRERYPRSNRESSLMLIAAESTLRIRDLHRARLEAGKLLLKFPNSKYADDAHWVLARTALAAERWDEAREQIDWLVGFAPDKQLAEAAAHAGEELDRFLALEAEEHPQRATVVPKVGLVLPLTSAVSGEAKDFLLGFTIAWQERGAGGMVVYDSWGDPVRAVRLAQQLAREDGVWGLVGGLTPGKAAAAAAVAQAERVPFLTTWCGAADLAAVGRFVFQGRADYTTIGRELGRHAMLDLGLAHFGILAPLTSEGRQVVRGFKKSVELGGGEVVAEEVYYPGTRDFSAQFKRLRAVGLRRAYDDSLRAMFAADGFFLADSHKFVPPAESLVAQPLPEGLELAEGEEPALTLSSELLDSLWDADIARLNEWSVKTKQEIDSLEIPLAVYDGFLMVIEPDAVPVAAPQFARFHLQTQLLGNERWGNRDELQRVQSYVDGIIYAEPLAAVGGEEYYKFAAKVSEPEGDDVNTYHLAGERAARMMGWAFSRAKSPDEVRLALSQIRGFKTLSGEVSLLKEERVDRKVTLVRFEGGKFNQVGRE